MKITKEWADYTWNPVTGCWGPGGTVEHPQRCSYCYAEKNAYRFNWKRAHAGLIGLSDPFEPQFWPDCLFQPDKVKKSSKILVCSMGDLFGDWVPREWIEAVLTTVASSPQHTFQFLTKNPKRYQEFTPWPDNCWLMTTITNQADAEERVPELLKARARVLGVSLEPMLGPVDLSPWLPMIDWIICGGETGYHARFMHPSWPRLVLAQCQAAGVPFFFTQWGEWAPGSDASQSGLEHNKSNPVLMSRVGRKTAGRLLDGREWNEVPHAEDTNYG